jgi:transposase-like protein
VTSHQSSEKPKKEKKACPPELAERRREYNMEIVETAENLYIYKQKTYEEISRITGVPVVTVQRWSSQYEWRKKKLEQVKRRVDYRKTLYEVRDGLLKKAHDTIDPQVIHALGGLQRIIDAEEKIGSQEEAPPNPEIFLGFMRDMVIFLKDRDPEALTALEKNFDEFISFAKQKYSKLSS